MRHWPVVTYTAHDGRTTNSRDFLNAVIDLYGKNVFASTTRTGYNEAGTHTHDYAIIYCRKQFNKTGDSVQVGTVTWAAER